MKVYRIAKKKYAKDITRKVDKPANKKIPLLTNSNLESDLNNEK